jgi:ketohexokinase
VSLTVAMYYSTSWAILIVYSTIGAGDTFNAGLLYGLIYRGRDWDFRKRLEFANLIAGLKVTQEGFANLQRALDSPSY